jgi:hypothetical protein
MVFIVKAISAELAEDNDLLGKSVSFNPNLRILTAS